MKRLLVNQSLFRGRWFIVTLVFLLLPLGLWAEDYNLTVAGTQVTDENADDVLGDGRVNWNNNTKTLTLENANISGAVVSNVESAITIHLVGTSTITTTEDQMPIQSNSSPKQDLTFTAAEGAMLLTNKTRTDGNAVICSGFSFSDEDDIPDGYALSWDAYGHCSLGKYYGLYLYAFVNGNDFFLPYYVTEANCDRLMGKYIESTDGWDNSVITISYDDSNKTLTLNNASPEIASHDFTTHLINCYGENVKNLTVMLLGENTLRQYAGEVGEAGLVQNEWEDGTVTFTTDPENPGLMIMPDIASYYDNSFVVDAKNVIYQNGLAYSEDEDGIRYIMFSETNSGYGLKVAGVIVNENNADNVLGDDDATVSFDADNNKLTLNNANINVENEDAIVSGLENLTIFLIGENTISCYGERMFNKTSAVDKATITFTTDETSNGSLSFMCVEEQIFGEGVTPVYNNVSIKHDGDSHYINSGLGISVRGVDVTLFNTGDVFGDGTVNYNSTTHTLTLNNATIESSEERAGIEYTNEEDLTIALIGNNSVQGGSGCPAIRKLYGVETPYLRFAKGNEMQHFSLTLTADSEDNLIDGFKTNYGDFFVYDEEDGSWYTSTISTTIFGGTGSADEPFLIKTPEDLKKMASYYNEGQYFSRNSHIRLNNDINCDGEEGFTSFADNTDANFCGVFDGNHKTISNLIMSGVGLFGYVEQDGDNVGTIKALTLDNFTLSGGNSSSNDIGGIVGTLDGGTITNCKLLNSAISCQSNSQCPTVGGIVGSLSNGSVNNCIVQNCSIKAQTSDKWASGANANAGGIAGTIIGGMVSGCQVKGTTTVLADYGNYSATVSSGAVVAKMNGGTLTDNTYDYSVSTSTVTYNQDTETTQTIVKNGYTQRGIGGKTWNEQTEQYEENPDVFEDDGAVLYCKTVILPKKTDNAQVRIEGREGNYYSMEDNGYRVAPNQTVTLDVTPIGESTLASFTVTNNITGEQVSTTASEAGVYSFVMPDSDVEVFATIVTRADIVWKAGEEEHSYEIEGSEVTADAGGYYLYTNGQVPWLYNPDHHAVTYSSSDESVATIDSKGTITFVGMGRTTISATVAQTEELQETTSSFTLKVYPQNAAFEKDYDLLFPGESVTITCPTADAEIWYYTGNQSRDDAVKYTGPITLTTIGETNIMAFTKSTKNDEVFESSTAVSGRFVVFEQPTISVASGTFNDDVEVTIGKLPTRYGTQVCYYFNDELSDDIYTSTDMLDETKYHVYVEDEVIKIIESKILKVFIMEQDSGKYYKKKAAEEEYTVIPKTELNISYAQNSREWASYYADEKSLETPTGLQAYVVTEVQEAGVTTSPISYIPQGEGILLKRTENIQEPIMAKAFMDVEPETASNKLKGTATSKSVKTENGDVYVLYNDGFTRAPSGSIPAHRAYLVLNDESAGARLLIWEDEETTGVSSVETESRQNNDTYYNLNGQRVNKPTKGLYICKGKKHIVK